MAASNDLFALRARSLVGVIHLPRLLTTSPAALVERVRTDAAAYADAGFDAVIVENFGDAPFPKNSSSPHVAALMAHASSVAREASGLPVGVNVLRNDGLTALAACHAASGVFVRVNILTGAAVTDQGIIEGDAHAVSAYRRQLADVDGNCIRILADIDVKHAAPLVERPLADVARETVRRAGADGLLITGSGTGESVDVEQLAAVSGLELGVPVWAASGVAAATVREILDVADGAIVGTAAKQGGVTTAPVDLARAKAIVDAA